MIGWLIFAADGLDSPVTYLLHLFGVGCPLFDSDSLYEIRRNLPFLVIMAVGCTPFAAKAFKKLKQKSELLAKGLGKVLALASLILCTCYLADSGYNPFLYFKF